MINASVEMVREVFSRVLEKQVFLFPEEMSLNEIPLGEDEWVEARISFHGPFEGHLSFALPKKAELELAANFLGKDVADPVVIRCAEDSVKEILNVICGNMLSELAGEDPIFDLSIPTLLPLSAKDRQILAAYPDSIGFDLEGMPAILRFQISDPVNPEAWGE